LNTGTKPTSNIFVWLLSQDSTYTVLPFEYVDRRAVYGDG
jgi:hypothetical protein